MVFVTAGVVTLSLVVQGVLLPRVVRWAQFPVDTSAEDERVLAEQVATQVALDALPGVAESLGTEPGVVDRTRREYEEHLQAVGEPGDTADHPLQTASRQYADLRLALIARKRQAVVGLRDDRQIDDSVLRVVQAQLDVEELRLSREGLVEE